jgi:hypothetical protein
MNENNQTTYGTHKITIGNHFTNAHIEGKEIPHGFMGKKIYVVIGEHTDREYDEFRIVKAYSDKQKAELHAQLANTEIKTIIQDYVRINGSIHSIWSHENKYKIEHDPLYKGDDWEYSVEEVEFE